MDEELDGERGFNVSHITRRRYCSFSSPRYTMESMNGTNSDEMQGSLAEQVMEENRQNAYESKTEIRSVKRRSVLSRLKELVSDKIAKIEGMRRTKVDDLYCNIAARSSVIDRAARVLGGLKTEFPYFYKCMLPSNVSYSYWMIFPTGFCKSFLPKYNSTVTLVDESGDECKTTYLFGRHGLSAGWRGFSISHKLRKGDILFFQLIDQCKFKVHIVRVHETEAAEAADCLMALVAASETMDPALIADLRRRIAIRGYKEE